MNRLTIADEKLPDGGMRMTAVDARKVAEHAMSFYSQLKKYEDLEEAGRIVRQAGSRKFFSSTASAA